MNNLLSGLIGALLGGVIAGVFGYLGAVRATKSSIEAPNSIFYSEKQTKKKEIEDIKKRHMYMIYDDMNMWVKYAFLRRNTVYRSLHKQPENMSYNLWYLNYLESFMMELDISEIKFIKGFHGITRKMSLQLEELRYSHDNDNELLNSIDVLLNYLGVKEEQLTEIMDNAPSLIDDDFILERCSEEYRNLLKKLEIGIGFEDFS